MAFDALPGPVIDFGDVNGELQPDLPHLLDAGAGHKAYLWQDNSTAQTFTVVSAGYLFRKSYRSERLSDHQNGADKYG